MTWQLLAPLWVIGTATLVLLGAGVYMLFVHRHHHSLFTAWLRRVGMVICLLAIALGPSVPGGYSAAGMLNLDVIFAVDTTTSMGAEDYNGSGERLDGVRKDIVAIANQMAGARFSLITFDQEARVSLPMTSDQSTLDTVAATMERENSNDSKGSSIDMPINLIASQIKDNKQKNPGRPDIVFYFGDGEQTIKQAPKSFSSLKPLVSGGAVLGYGTTQGGKMKIYYGFGTDGSCDDDLPGECYIQDLTQPPDPTTDDFPLALSKMNPTNLKNIASQMGISYVNRNSGGSLQGVFDTSKIQKVADSARQVTYNINLYWIAAIVLTGLLLWELAILWIHTQPKGRRG